MFDGITQINLYTDGACLPKNPGGIATMGWVMYERLENGESGRQLRSGHRVVAEGGNNATNNYAEYCGLGFPLRFLFENGYQGSIYLFSDSQLLVNQVAKNWKCNKKHLQKLRDRIWTLASDMGLKCCSPSQKENMEALADPDAKWLVLEWIPREQNEEADALSKKAYDEFVSHDKLSVHCSGCNWYGVVEEVDLEEDNGISCPQCGTQALSFN